MPARTIQPALNAVLRLGDGRAYGMLGGVAVGISGGPRDIALVFEAFVEFVIGAADMLAKDVAAGGLVLGEVARGALPLFNADFVPTGRGGNGGTRAARRLR